MSGIPGKGLEFQTADWNSTPKNQLGKPGKSTLSLDSNSVWFSRKKFGIPDTCLENQREQNSLEIQKKASNSGMQYRSGIPDNCLENQTKQISLVNQTMSGKPDMNNWSGVPDCFCWSGKPDAKEVSGFADELRRSSDGYTENDVWNSRLRSG